MRKRLLGALAALVVCLGCKNPFTEFYRDNGAAALISDGVIARADYPNRQSGTNPEDDYLTMIENGYEALGYSSFNGGTNVNWEDAIEQGKKLGASVVILYNPKHSGTRSGVYTQSIPTTTTSYSTGTATAYGPGGTVNAYGSGITTTYGTQQVAVPYTVNRYDYMATYWAKVIKPPILGVRWRDLTGEERTALGSNKGARIVAVVKGSPAFKADILRNDILKKINGMEVVDIAEAGRLTHMFRGLTVSIELIRNGQVRTFEMTLNQP